MKRLLVFAALAAVTLCAPVSAEMPYPTNPLPCTGAQTDPPCIDPTAFADYLFLAPTDPPTVPNDYGSDNWKFTSAKTGDPDIDSNPQELFGVKGASVDLAWQVTTGRPDVLIAVLDSGIRWRDQLPDVVNKFYLNRGELPEPECATPNTRDPYDCNNDGVFTVKDYADDPRVRDHDQNGNGMIDPEDLIFLFSDGKDDDHNGYVDDISGWDFFQDDNDPLDDVRYGHGTGESHDSSAEANNGGGDPGSCPNCLLLETRVGDSFVTDVNLFAQGVVFAVDSGARIIQEALGTLNESRFGQEAIDYAYHNGVVVIASAADEESNHHNYPANYNHTVEVNSVTRFQTFGPLVQSPKSYLYLNGCTNYSAHIAVAVPSSSCSSEATGRSSGMAGLVISAARNAVDHGILTNYRRDDGSPAPFPLSAEEIKQILTMTADDINFDGNYTTMIAVPGVKEMQRFPSIAGFDQYFGYGRINANSAVRRVAAGDIPPEASIESPAWFAIVDPTATSMLSIVGRVAANRAASFSCMLEVAPGVQPAEDKFQVVSSVSDLTQAFTGELGVIDLGDLQARMPHGTEGPAVDDSGLPDPDRFTFTVRVRVVDDHGRRGEDRRAFALHHDPDLLPGFPRTIGSDGVSSPLTADLDGNGVDEIIFGDSNGAVHALSFTTNGGGFTELPGWPVHTDPLELHTESPGYASAMVTPVSGAVLGAVAVGDLDRDGYLEVVATDMQGKAYVWDRHGMLRTGFPVSTLADYSNSRLSERDLGTPDGQVPDRHNWHNGDNRVGRALAGGPVLANLDGSADGSLEIIAGGFDRHIYVWTNTGEPLPGWPLLLKDPSKVKSVDPITNAVTLNDDAQAEIGTKILVPPSVGDLNGDGQLELVAVVNEEYRDANVSITDPILKIFRVAGAIDPGNTRVYAIDRAGAAAAGSGLTHGWNPSAFLPGWPVKTTLITTGLLPTVGSGSNGPPALADVDGDGRLEIGTFSVVGPLYVFTPDGVSFFGRDDMGQDITLESEVFGTASNAVDAPSLGSLGGPVLAEFAGAGKGFQFLGTASGLGKLIDAQLTEMQRPAENHLGVWEITKAGGSAASGAFSPAFPRQVNDLQFVSAPAVADITGDGLPEALAGSAVYDLHAVDINGNEAPGWPKFTDGWMIGTPAVGDVDGDGRLEVIATTREGNLFVWKTNGDECGFVPWRHWHHDEWGTGNYHTDARPPAALSPSDVVQVNALAGSARIELARVPGDDLYCGTAQFDVRFADTVIDSAAAFDAATPVTGLTGPAHGGRQAGTLTIEDARLVGRQVYLAVTGVDDQHNRSAVTSLGLVSFPSDATPTPTASPSPTTTPTPTATPTTTPTVPPTVTSTLPPTASPTPPAPTSTPSPSATSAPPTATSTAGRRSNNNGCAVTPPGSAGSFWPLLPVAVMLLRRRRRTTPL